MGVRMRVVGNWVVARAAAVHAAGAVGPAREGGPREQEALVPRQDLRLSNRCCRSARRGSRSEIAVGDAARALRAMPRARWRRSGRSSTRSTPDAVVIIGNDQREFFNAGLTPAITVYRGDEISNVQHLHEDRPGLNIAEPANSPAEGATYPGATGSRRSHPRLARRRGLRSGAVGRTRRAVRHAAASRTPTGSCITRFCRTRRRPACRSS